MTFKTLKSLRKRGVKVELGFPDEMWDSPDAEVTRLKNRVSWEFLLVQVIIRLRLQFGINLQVQINSKLDEKNHMITY